MELELMLIYTSFLYVYMEIADDYKSEPTRTSIYSVWDFFVKMATQKYSSNCVIKQTLLTKFPLSWIKWMKGKYSKINLNKNMFLSHKLKACINK